MSDEKLQVEEKKPVEQAAETTSSEQYFIPPVDIFETEEEVTVIAEMPGIDNTGVAVSLEENVLTIRGRRTDKEDPGGKILLREYESGHYLRRFTLAETIDQENIKARMADGLLSVTLPKAKPSQPKKIEVSVG